MLEKLQYDISLIIFCAIPKFYILNQFENHPIIKYNYVFICLKLKLAFSN